MIIKYFYFLAILAVFSNLKAEDFHTELLNKLDDSFPAEIFFSQTGSDKKTSKGWMVIGKKGHARVEFEPPNHFLIVADGNWLIVHDAQYDRTSYLPIDRGILGALLYPEKFNKINQLDVIKKKNNDKFYYSLASESFEGSELILYFDKEYKKLKGWDIIENNITSIKVKILQISKIKSLDTMNKNIFKFPEFMRANEKGFLGPYERTIRKIPKGKTN